MTLVGIRAHADTTGVGKSCLLLRFCDDSWTPSFITTIGIDFKIRTIEVDGKRIKLQIVSKAGMNEFLTPSPVGHGRAGALPHDHYSLLPWIDGYSHCLRPDRREELPKYVHLYKLTCTDVRNWYKDVQQHANDGACKILVGNKCDWEEKRVCGHRLTRRSSLKSRAKHLQKNWVCSTSRHPPSRTPTSTRPSLSWHNKSRTISLTRASHPMCLARVARNDLTARLTLNPRADAASATLGRHMYRYERDKS